MKILKFSGIVVGIHLLALILIFANPGCSSSAKPQPAAGDTVTKSDAAPTITVPSAGTADTSGTAGTGTSAPISFNQDNVRYSPTRPGSPAATTLQAEPVSNVMPATTYTIVSGDSLSAIAKKNHLTVAELAAANNLNANTAKLHPGQKLIIPGKAPASLKTAETATVTAAPHAPGMTPVAVEPSPAKAGAEVVKHTVKARETLSAIAAKYGVKQGAIAEANNITDPQKIRPGMELIIPGWQPTGKMKNSPTTGGEGKSAPSNAATDQMRPSAPPPSAEVPVIQVEEAPAVK